MKIKTTILATLFLFMGYGTTIAQNTDKLPATIATFFDNHFLTETIVNTNKHNKEYHIKLSDGSELEFDRNGNLQKMKNPNGLPLTPINENITEYIKDNYKVYHVVKFEKENSGYKVKLSNDLVLQFNSRGDLVNKKSK